MVHVAPGSPGSGSSRVTRPRASVIEGDRVTAIHRVRRERAIRDAVRAGPATPRSGSSAWRELLPDRRQRRRSSGRSSRERRRRRLIDAANGPPIWRIGSRRLGAAAPRHDRADVVFTGAALVLLLLRSYDLTAGLCVLALAFSGVGGGGPLLGAETRSCRSAPGC